MAASHLVYAQKRRSMRINQAMILTVRGMDAFQKRYVEKVPTLTLSCHGCMYRSKHELALGSLVLLELAQRGFVDSTQARVRWLQETIVGKERVWEVAVELETPSNFWGVVSPPEDWLGATGYKCVASNGHELQVVVRAAQQIMPVPDNPTTAHPVLEPAPASPSPLVAGLSDHIQKLVSEAVTSVVVKENARLIERFRAQLDDEMTGALERVVGRCKEQLIRRAVSELTEALELSARKFQEHSIGNLEESMNSAGQHMTAQLVQVNDRISSVADGAVERLNRTADQCNEETLNRFRVRSLSICEQAVDFLQQSMQRFTVQIEQGNQELKNQFESYLNERLTRAECELDKKSRAILDESQLALAKLSAACQETVQGDLKALTTSAVEQVAATLNEQAVEISKRGLSQLQTSTRRYLDTITGSIADISTKMA